MEPWGTPDNTLLINHLEESVENCCDYLLSIIELYLKEKRIGSNFSEL